MNPDLASVILTSVVIASIVSSLISGFFIFMSERSKRISEEKRVKLEIAAKLTELHDKKVVEFIKMKTGKVFWRNHVNSFKNYYKFLEEIWNKGKYEGKDFDSPIE
ncbi:MAG: hypothetical protein AAB496_01570 [Patescibacteria group bacterium]